MSVKLLLVRNNKILLELPLSGEAWSQERLHRELGFFEEEYERFTKLFDALSHHTRLRMVKRLFEEDNHTLGFTDFTRELGLNPKIVWQNTKKLCDGGLIEKNEEGKYSFSEAGRAEFLMLSLVLRQLRTMFESI
ncbi:MAG: winged helix-turn-helix transcriptional regulator [Candidatus Bathyarchaeota archaeon]|nr:MAG: winged helix-turn-helix transcriptional regulator [Candidatus Bathyarchaeota archaeon]